MDVSLFIARKLRFKGRIAVVSIAVSFLVMIIAVSVSSGFRNEIRDGISFLSGDIQLTPVDLNFLDETSPVDRYPSYLEHVRDHKCRAHQCKALLTYTITPTLCIGCHLCAKNCPADAIIGDVRKPHIINPNQCIKCGMCMARCKFKAISVN